MAKNKAAQALGRLGAKARAKKYSSKDFARWGKLGKGVPKTKKN